ncbi:MAG TPA: RNA polymerase sigma factor [Bacteroidales bacterium]|nr:RNA polymerase sigma factor [Bacteroidales bacterium]
MEVLKKIVKGCLRQNKADQHRLYTLFSQKMYGVCLRYAGNYHEAQDILQEGFLKVFEKLHSFKWQGSLEGWIKRIMIHSAIEKYRERIYFLSVEDFRSHQGVYLENQAPEKIALDDLLNLIQMLPDQYRMVFNMAIIEGLNHKEISEILSISESTSRSNLSRARSLLQEWILNEERILEKAI